jgi:hypothetical protein
LNTSAAVKLGDIEMFDSCFSHRLIDVLFSIHRCPDQLERIFFRITSSEGIWPAINFLCMIFEIIPVEPSLSVLEVRHTSQRKTIMELPLPQRPVRETKTYAFLGNNQKVPLPYHNLGTERASFTMMLAAPIPLPTHMLVQRREPFLRLSSANPVTT